MPKLVIDNLEIEVPEGTKVIDAAEKLGIMIPRFCYHPGLGSLGACRMCAVKFVDGPVKGIEMSCMEDAQDGMVVSTTDPEAVEFRKYVIEWLMMNHPHDCPVCDEGGHCLLQDETVSGGHGIRRYPGKKRTYRDQHLGEFVQHEMNRCIHCWRCRRFYQEFAGYRDFGALQIANRTYFGRYEDGALESPFSGNIIDICPTGVLTDKPSRYRGRRWDYERAPSLCIHCSLGCSVVGSARYREIIRLEARLNQAVNGYFICDRGRYGFQYANRSDRPRRARVGEAARPWPSALDEAAEKLMHIHRARGPQAVACLGSPRCSVETIGHIVRLSRDLGWQEPAFFMDATGAGKTRKAVSRLTSSLAASMREAEEADFILAVATDPVNEAPMLSLAMRQAFRKGAKVVVLDPRPVSLPFAFEHIPVLLEEMPLCQGILLKHTVTREEMEGVGAEATAYYERLPERYSTDPSTHESLLRLAGELRDSRKPLLICGTDVGPDEMPDAAADFVSLLRGANRDARLLFTFPGPNSFGAALLSKNDRSFSDILHQVEKKEIKALLVVEADPFGAFPDQERWVEAFKNLDLLIVLDYLPTRSAERAHILLPTATLFETVSHWVNHEGRLQKASAVHGGGIPFRQVSGGSHPPRIFESLVPGGEAKPAGAALADLGSPLSSDKKGRDIWPWLIAENPAFKHAVSLDPEDQGIRVIPEETNGTLLKGRHDFANRAQQDQNSLDLLIVDWTFGTEELSGFSSFAERGETPPLLMMRGDEAARLGLSDGDKVTLRLPGGSLEIKLKAVRNMARGLLVMPKHRRLAWQKARSFFLRLSTHDIKRS
jgi:NADH-quinone oxidoreductase subunit G